MIRTVAVAWLGALVPFLAIDLLWIGVIARDFYRGQLGPLMLDQPRLGVAFLFYALYCLGLVIFAVLPGLRGESLVHAALLGAAFGFFAYATYDLTNLATLKGFPVKMAVVDMAWGTLLGGVVAACSFLVARKFG
jgi:uncharacterized membrane protein